MHSAAAIFPVNSPRLSPSLRSMSSTSSFASAHSSLSTAPFSLNALLAPETSLALGAKGRASSISSAAASSTCSYSRDELERERELFGESAMGVFEPRDQVMGFWGLTEVLKGENQ